MWARTCVKPADEPIIARALLVIFWSPWETAGSFHGKDNGTYGRCVQPNRFVCVGKPFGTASSQGSICVSLFLGLAFDDTDHSVLHLDIGHTHFRAVAAFHIMCRVTDTYFYTSVDQIEDENAD